MKVKFPSNFFWGSSISSYQLEGDNFNSDWFSWEKQAKLVPAGRATNYYNLFKADHSLACELGHNTLRFSIEWSRIFPSKTSSSQQQLDHYIEVVKDLSSKGIKPIVCLHHFTNPIWFNDSGGWLESTSVEHFVEYVKTVVNALKDHVDHWITFNEPVGYVYNGFLDGNWAPGYKSLTKALRALKNIKKAHVLAYKAIKDIYKEKASVVFIAKHMRVFKPCKHFNFGQNNFFAYLRSSFFNFDIINSLTKKKSLDAMGLNYYCAEHVKMGGVFGDECLDAHHAGKRNGLGWFLDPEGFYLILKKLNKYRLPIIITENGTSDASGEDYSQFIKEHIKMMALAYNEGVNICGYLWWSLLDNFEWDKGFGHRFGLIGVDYNTFKRTVKPFALEYKKIIENNFVEI